MPRQNENQHVEANPDLNVKKESIINDSPSSVSSETEQNKRAEFAQELNPLNHIPLALEMNKFDELISCIEEEE